jgi:4-hydroxy-3-methylbut-2-en-1-yl diphosphate reductase
MNIVIEEGSGFCFGVHRAIEMSEQALQNRDKVYCLGQIVHNEQEEERLRQLGLVTIDHDRFRQLKNATALVRAHGEPPETYRLASENNIRLIDASCPIVLRLQEKIRDCYLKYKDGSGQVVIFGKKGHAEVIGLMGQTNNRALLLESLEDLNKIDFRKPLCLFSQTTRSTRKYQEVIEGIRKAYRNAGAEPIDSFLAVHHTICGQVANREPKIRAFARKMDRVLFASGKASSNGRMLFNACRQENQNSFMISSVREIRPDWLAGQENIGICGATSTPKWLLDEVYHFVKVNFSL